MSHNLPERPIPSEYLKPLINSRTGGRGMRYQDMLPKNGNGLCPSVHGRTGHDMSLGPPGWILGLIVITFEAQIRFVDEQMANGTGITLTTHAIPAPLSRGIQGTRSTGLSEAQDISVLHCCSATEETWRLLEHTLRPPIFPTILRGSGRCVVSHAAITTLNRV